MNEELERQAFQDHLDWLVKRAAEEGSGSSAAKQALKNLLVIGLGSAAGAGAGYGVRHLLRRAALKEIETGKRTLSPLLPILGGAGGAFLGSLHGIISGVRDSESERLRAEATKTAEAAAPFHIPYSSCPTKIEPPKKTRKKYPFQGYIIFQGLEIDIENKKGSTRSGTDGTGKKWSTFMHHHYGEIRGTEGVDGDKLDCYVGPNQDSPLVIVVHQQNPRTKEYDEDKVMLGFNSEAEAVAAYKRQYDRPDYYQSHTTMPIGRFWRWVQDERKQGKKVAAGEAQIRPKEPASEREMGRWKRWGMAPTNYTMWARPDLKKRFEEFLRAAHWMGNVGHSAVLGLSIDGDGSDRLFVQQALPGRPEPRRRTGSEYEA